MRYAIINKKTNVVENIIMWNGDGNVWKCPDKYYEIESIHAGIGDDYLTESKEFSRKLSLLKPKVTEDSILNMKKLYEEKKTELKSFLLFENIDGTIEG